MVIRLAEFDQAPAFHRDPELLSAFRRWLSSQPGYRDGWHATDSTTGRVVSVSVWEDRASLEAMRARPFPGGSLGAKPDRLTIYDHVESLTGEVAR